jgi:3-phosphoshikimate 1-carboxyvinyltransferase
MDDPSDAIEIEPLTSIPRATIRVPGSKSLTNRALVIAALADGHSLLTGALDSEDTRVMVDALDRLGFAVESDPVAGTIHLQGKRGAIPAQSADLFVANSGTTLRFLTAMLGLGHGRYRLDGVPRMRERPVDDLLLALNRLGANARSEFGTGCPPVIIEADGLDGGFVNIRGDISSQFLSGLLMALPAAKKPTTIEVDGPLVSQPYISMTLGVMNAFGADPSNQRFRRFNVSPQKYNGRTYPIEPDASAASYFFAAAAITGGTITVEGLGTKSIQGDMAFVDVLEHMGCRVERSPHSTTVTGGPLNAPDVDMNSISDTVMTLGVVGLFARGVTRIRNVAHIRHKETDRILALAQELRKVGAIVEEQPDGLWIIPPDKYRSARITTYNDHRIAMSLALVGLRVPGITILDPGCVGKTYPGFWEDLGRLREQA